jgi:hypothetical protein
MIGRKIRTITADVNIYGTWHTVSGWDAPLLLRPNPEKGVLRLFSGEEPEQTGGTLTEWMIQQKIADGLADEWYFGMGQWRRAHFGEMRD